ncbi:hypothetical protein H257_00464 [Aphanomyces astaci]|uniref:Rho-GAP domain-containing protein n=2 Tax=Aphanomyces astaci TaxID=112090 RepID=W4HBZ5_APHAT|nr:hypothetical protein H257_00464 [Aphanomyces astaci]ETV89081.1 hypothetical protein H257_00464 [Aphanomyces astaci]|eukprot:XP_009821481.1 hypothetical protein H257_00464 [Aphanomyces astaci]
MSSEVTVYSFKAALYSLDESSQEWLLSDTNDDPVAQYYVFMDNADVPKFRMVGWVEDSGDVVLNNALTKHCIWLPVNEYFVQFTTPDDITVGLSFADLEQAQEASTIVLRILQNLVNVATSESNNAPREYSEGGEVDALSKTTSELKEYLTFVRTHGTSSLEYLQACAEAVHVVDDVDTLLSSEALDRVDDRFKHRSAPSFLSDDDRRSLRLQYAAAQLHQSLVPPSRRSSSSAPPPPPAAVAMKDVDFRRGSAPLGCLMPPSLRRCSSSINSSLSSSSRCSSRRQSLANFDEVERATMAAVDSNLQDEEGGERTCNSPAFLRATFGTYTGVGPRTSSSSSATSDHTSVISRPYEAKQEMHVTFNAVLARYEGLPLAWVGLNKQFGLPMEAMPKRVVDGYDSKIPAVLQMMKEYLVLHGGLETEGIFRLAPDKEQCSRVKDAINNGSFGGCNDVHIVANLIKVWFRDLPTSLFNVIPDKIMYKTCTLKTPESVMDMLADVPEASKIVILWLLDLMAEVVKHEKATKMSSKNMAIVLSPNLFSIESDNPMVALTMSQKVAEFTTVLLNARLALHHGYVK